MQGYVCNFQVYTGKAGKKSSTTLGERVVCDLVEPFLFKGHRVFCDRFFTSPSLAQRLWEKQTPVCGTVQLNRKGMPKNKPTVKKSSKHKHERVASLCFLVAPVS